MEWKVVSRSVENYQSDKERVSRCSQPDCVLLFSKLVRSFRFIHLFINFGMLRTNETLASSCVVYSTFFSLQFNTWCFYSFWELPYLSIPSKSPPSLHCILLWSVFRDKHSTILIPSISLYNSLVGCLSESSGPSFICPYIACLQ